MPKTPSDKLFRLIKSLSGSEKRYFKVFNRQDGDRPPKYLLLFDAVDAQPTFDEEALKATVYGSEPITSRKYSELKAYLYDLILKSLQSYDEKSTIDLFLKRQLQSLRILYRRGLFEDCRELLSKITRQAARYEKFNVLLEVLEWEKQIAYARTDIAYLDAELERIEREEKQVLEQLQNLSAYRNIFLRLLVDLRKDSSLFQESRRHQLQTYIDFPLLHDYLRARSHSARVLFHRVFSLYYYAMGDLQKFYETSKELIRLMESCPHFLKEDVSEYISALSNYIRSCGEIQDYAGLESALEKLYKVRPLTRDDELKIHRQYYQGRLAFCIEKGDFAKGMKVLQEHLRKKQKFDPAFFENNSFYAAYFYITFGAGHYEEALKYLNKLLTFSRSIERQDLQSVARILNLIIHFELGNSLLLTSLLRSTYRFLRQRDALHEIERKVMQVIREASEAPSERERREVFAKYQPVFQEWSQDPLSSKLLQRPFNILAWFESKIRNEAFSTIIRERFQAGTRGQESA